MNAEVAPPVGPVLCGTVFCNDLSESVALYEKGLGMELVEHANVGAAQARCWEMDLEGAPQALLKDAAGKPWLRLIELPARLGAAPRGGFKRGGWMAMEILVADAERAYERASRCFQTAGEPLPLDVSPDIIAAQVIGPGGEALYLTQIKHPVPPFDLPVAAREVDGLFIGVLSTPSREKSAAFYEKLASVKALRFDTKLGCVNRGWNYPEDKKHPVATVQLHGKSLLEIDELPFAEPLPAGPVPGIGIISLSAAGLGGKIAHLPGRLYGGRGSSLLRSPTGEWVEVIERE